MEIEVIEFFPFSFVKERETLSGTLRIRIVDLKINLLGVFVSRRKDSWQFSMPGRKATHHQTGEEIRYPYFVFEEKWMQRELMDQIRLKGKEFIEARLADSSRPLMMPETKGKWEGETKHLKAGNDVPESKETAPIEKSDFNPSIAMKKWVDPPKRIQTAKRYK